LKYTLLAPPSKNALYRNVPGKGRVKTKTYLYWQEAASLFVPRRDAPIDPAIVEMRVQVNNRRDLDGYIAPVMDFLVARGVLRDDRAKHVRKLYVSWADVQGVEITVRPA